MPMFGIDYVPRSATQTPRTTYAVPSAPQQQYSSGGGGGGGGAPPPQTQGGGTPTGNSALDQLISSLAPDFGGDVSQQDQRYILDVVDALKAQGGGSGQYDPGAVTKYFQALAGQVGHIPDHDLMTLLDSVESFAGSVGWRYMPNPGAILGLYQSGAYRDQRQAAQYLSGTLPAEVRGAMPWAAAGISETAYHQKRDSIYDIQQELIGTHVAMDVNEQSSIDMFISQGWSDQRIRDNLKTWFGAQDQFKYLKHGYTYDSFQQYKTQQRQHIISRFGQAAADKDQSYIENLDQPLQSVAASGGAVSYSKSAQQDSAGRSEVR